MEKQIDVVSEIKSKLLLSEVVGQYVKLKKSGTKYKGLCPFHNEKTPSFFVDDQKGLYHCFGCGASGDIFTFIQKIENVDFVQALKKLADIAGVSIKNLSFNSTSSKEKELLYKLNQEFLNYFKKEFKINKIAQKYIQSRDLDKKTVEFFEIGFCGNSVDGNFINYLQKKYDINSDFLIRSSFLRKYNNKYYPFFKNRIIIPIKNLWGEIVGFGGRVIFKDDNPKYLNTSENLIFQKKNILYNLNNVRKLKENDEIIVVEGYFDVITAYKNGIQNVAAPLGTAFGESHAKIISRMFNKIYFLFDNDKAGENATLRSIEISLYFPFVPKVILLPEKIKDLDEFFKKYNNKDFEEIKNKSEDGIKYFLKKILNIGIKDRNINIVYKKLMSIVLSINDPIKEDLIFKSVQEVDGIFDYYRLKEIFKDFKNNNKINILDNLKKQNRKDSKNRKVELEFCIFLTNNLDFIEYTSEYIKPEDFEDEFSKKYYKQLLLYPNYSSKEIFLHSFDEEIQQIIFSNFDKENYKINTKKQLEDYLSYFKLRKLQKTMDFINKEIEKVSKKGEFPEELLMKKKLILEQIKKLKNFRLKNRF